VTELNLSERSTTARVVDDLLHNAPDISMALSEVERAELGRSLVETGVSR
jgi:ubiquinone/menaquinone biosynthesis C-methylase UbiE